MPLTELGLIEQIKAELKRAMCEFFRKVPPDKACTGRWGTVRLFKHFAQRGFEFFLLPGITLAGNASR